MARRKPGLGEYGKQRIREDLRGAPFTVPPLYDEATSTDVGEPPSSDGPPKEPPKEDDDEDKPKLPDPVFIDNILQSAKPYPYKAARPDLIEHFHNDGPNRSTRVRAIQWVPTSMDGTEVRGDIFVAFARPNSGKSTLTLYTDFSESEWTNFTTSTSLGKYVDNVLNSHGPVPHGLGDYANYKDLHPDFKGSYIFDPENLKKWFTIRTPNSAGTNTRKPRSIEGKAASFGKKLETEGFSSKDFRSEPVEDY